MGASCRSSGSRSSSTSRRSGSGPPRTDRAARDPERACSGGRGRGRSRRLLGRFLLSGLELAREHRVAVLQCLGRIEPEVTCDARDGLERTLDLGEMAELENVERDVYLVHHGDRPVLPVDDQDLKTKLREEIEGRVAV